MMYLFLSCISSSEQLPQENEAQTEVLPVIEGSLLPSSDCQSDHTPILFVHGFLAAGDGFDRHAARFAYNGHCLDQMFALDWDNLSQEDALQMLSNTIDDIMLQTQKNHIDLVGHSAGGSLSVTRILQEEELRIRRYVHVGSSPFEEGLPIPWLNLTSDADPIAPGNDIEGTNNVRLTEEDHFAVITSPSSFSAMYSFLSETQPTYTEYETNESPILFGKALDFGNNIPTEGKIEVYSLDFQTGLPDNSMPIYTQKLGEYGYFGPLLVQSETHYELRLIPEDGPTIHHFFAPFDHDTRFIRLRSLPEEGIAAQFLSSLPLEEDTSVSLVNYSAHSGMIVGRDSLMLDGIELLNEERANIENNTIALFHTDINEDQSNGPDPGTFALFPFLAGSDTYWEPNPEQSISVSFNQNIIHVPKYGNGIVLTLQ